MKGFEGGQPTVKNEKVSDGRLNDGEQAQANMATMHEILNGEEAPANKSEKFDDKNNMTDAQRAEANVNQVNAMFEENRINPSAEKAEAKSSETTKAETTGEAKKAESVEGAAGKEKRDIAEKIKGILGKGKARLENVNGNLSGKMKWLEASGIMTKENSGEVQSVPEKRNDAEAIARSIGIRGVQAAEFVGSVAKNMGKEIGDFGKTAAGLAAEGGRMAKKGIEIVFDRAAEKLTSFENKSAQAFENLLGRSRKAGLRFMESINGYRAERMRRKAEGEYMRHLEKVVSLETKIKKLEELRKRMKEGENNKRLGRLSTEIGQAQIDLEKEKEKIGQKEISANEESTEGNPNVININKFKEKRQADQAENGSSVEELREAS